MEVLSPLQLTREPNEKGLLIDSRSKLQAIVNVNNGSTYCVGDGLFANKSNAEPAKGINNRHLLYFITAYVIRRAS